MGDFRIRFVPWQRLSPSVRTYQPHLPLTCFRCTQIESSSIFDSFYHQNSTVASTKGQPLKVRLLRHYLEELCFVCAQLVRGRSVSFAGKWFTTDCLGFSQTQCSVDRMWRTCCPEETSSLHSKLFVQTL